MGELSGPCPGTQAVLPRGTIVYDPCLDLDRLSAREVHRTEHHTVVLVIACAPTLDASSYSMCLVPTESGPLLGWVYNWNVRTYV